MKHPTAPLALCLALALALAGCATAPPPTSSTAAPAAGSDCHQLGAAIERSEAARRAATDKQAEAWKAVVPFAVAARYASGKAEAADAEKQLNELQAAARRQGCDRHLIAKEQP